jgi:hypothetical protein
VSIIFIATFWISSIYFENSFSWFKLEVRESQITYMKEITMEEHVTKDPELFPIADGWAAHGDGWAVHGATREEALANYRKAEQRRREILAMPPWYMQRESQSTQGGQNV